VRYKITQVPTGYEGYVLVRQRWTKSRISSVSVLEVKDSAMTAWR
jgi:hypothetical protein